MDGIAKLAHQLDREKVLRARGMSIPEKFRAGSELFEEACELSRAGIRARHPAWLPEAVEQELARRIEIGRKTEKALAR